MIGSPKQEIVQRPISVKGSSSAYNCSSNLARFARPSWYNAYSRLQGTHPITLIDSKRRRIDELDDVVLRVSVQLDHERLHAGEVGTVVHRYKDGVAFEVEFGVPSQAVVTLKREEIELFSG